MAYMAIVAVLLFIVLCLLIKWYYVFNKYNRHLKCFSGPPLLPILGCALDFPSNEVILDTFFRYFKTYGPTVKLSIGFEMRLLSGDPEFIEFILSSNKLIDKIYDYNYLVPWLGTGLVTSTGQKWKHRRKVLTPAFHFKILDQFLDVFQASGDVLMEKLSGEVGNDSFDVYDYIKLYALDVICESAMGISVNAQKNPNSPYVRAVHDMCHIAMKRLTSPLQQNDWTFMLFKNYWKQKKVLKILHDQTNSVINNKLKSGVLNTTTSTDEYGSKKKLAFLDLMLSYQLNGETLPSEGIREEVDTFMFAGHDTTTSAISFTLFALSKYQVVQQKVFEELESIFDDTDRAPTYADLQNMKYLEMVIKETLRMYTPVPFIGREVVEDTKYKDITLPAGLGISIFFHWLHNDPNIFETPDLFIPERFDPNNTRNKNPFIFVPFSAGPRNCIGQKFAMLELKSVISKVVRSFKILPAIPEHHPQLLVEAVMRSTNGIKIRLEKRNAL